MASTATVVRRLIDIAYAAITQLNITYHSMLLKQNVSWYCLKTGVTCGTLSAIRPVRSRGLHMFTSQLDDGLDVARPNRRSVFIGQVNKMLCFIEKFTVVC